MKHDPPFGGWGVGMEDEQIHSLAQFVCAGRAFLLNRRMIVFMILSWSLFAGRNQSCHLAVSVKWTLR